ncbi:MAG TPA: hypothetical protein PLJ62_09760 [Thermoflexales bacterium]|nr:hypothetical protein [Thermoflexales bacterium]HQW35706.1 hypothetical protein [Thermoflexales bacterium]HQZ22976.1 hypothetical protein [Thermoflexales bacterium]HRA00472.1 hypothetical protein [Thermoflexales bacterium]
MKTPESQKNAKATRCRVRLSIMKLSLFSCPVFNIRRLRGLQLVRGIGMLGKKRTHHTTALRGWGQSRGNIVIPVHAGMTDFLFFV